MDAATEVVCPFCNHKGVVRSVVAIGTKIRCQKCRATFGYGPPAFVKAEEPIELPVALDPFGAGLTWAMLRNPSKPRTIEERMKRVEVTNRLLTCLVVGLAFWCLTAHVRANEAGEMASRALQKLWSQSQRLPPGPGVGP